MERRAEHEKKSISKSLKISPNDFEVINEKMKERKVNFNQYMIECAVHSGNGLTPEILCKIENIIEKCARIAGQSDKDTMDSIRMEANALWDCLK